MWRRRQGAEECKQILSTALRSRDTRAFEAENEVLNEQGDASVDPTKLCSHFLVGVIS